MMDWRIGRLVRKVNRNFTDTEVSGLTLQPNKTRVAIMFGINGDISLAYDATTTLQAQVNVLVDDVACVAVTSYNPIVMFALTTHGELPTRKFTFTVQNGSPSVAITEWFMPEAMLTEALQSLQREYPRWTP